MADSPLSTEGLIQEFRRQIGDTSYNYVQCEIICNDPVSTVALLEVSDSVLMTTISGGSAGALSLNLLDPAYSTVEKLIAYIATRPQYFARVATGGEGTHISADFEVIPPKDILRRYVQLKTRRWSDSEISEMLNRALTRLGRDTATSYDLINVPSNIKDLMFTLAKIEAYWDQVNNSTKRHGVDLRVDDFRSLHTALLEEYDRALAAYKSSIPVPVSTFTPEELDEMGSGEIIVGTKIRTNWRTGRKVPSSLAGFPAAEQMAATFIGGAKVQLNWTRSHADNFYQYEIWRGTTSSVSNISEVVRPVGSVAATGTKILMSPEVARTVWVDGGTSPLPPGTYFYRLYVYNTNGDWAASEAVSATVV